MSLKFDGRAFRCGDEHSLFIEQPPRIAVRSFYSWAQNGVIEVFGGRMGRPIMVYAWVHHSGFSSLKDVDDYLKTLDRMAGEFGTVSIKAMHADNSDLERPNCRFVGFRRLPFPGQEHPTPIQALGTMGNNYGDWHIAGEFHFFQLNVE